MSSISVVYANEPCLDVDAFCRVLLESGLGATRPTGDRPRMQQMLDQADLVVTARLDRLDRALVGVARSITDFSWCCYLSELAVSSDAQGLGVGKGLLDETRRLLGPQSAWSWRRCRSPSASTNASACRGSPTPSGSSAANSQ